MLGLRSAVPVSGSRDQRIAAVAAYQRGFVSRGQLLAAGVASNAIDRARAAGRLHRCHRGVYRAGPDIDVQLGPETAALLALRDGAVLSDHTAALMWGMRVPDPAEIHVLVEGGPAGTVAGVRVHRTHSLDPRHTRVHRGLRSPRRPGPSSTSPDTSRIVSSSSWWTRRSRNGWSVPRS